jgi:hypothetical protein
MASSVASPFVEALLQGRHHFGLTDFAVRILVDGIELEQRQKRS